MSVQGFPRQTRVQNSCTGSQITLDIDFESHHVPPGIRDTLEQMGYVCTEHDPDTNEDLFKIDISKRPQDNSYPLTEFRFKWFEALAYEFANFITLGNAR